MASLGWKGLTTAKMSIVLQQWPCGKVWENETCHLWQQWICHCVCSLVYIYIYRPL